MLLEEAPLVALLGKGVSTIVPKTKASIPADTLEERHPVSRVTRQSRR